ncbi:MAG: SulP family inorganic anion transporter [Luteibaculaceae bacterium]
MLRYFKNDFSASIVVFLVALPLCLGIALASGAPLISGLLSGVIGGILVGLLSGSHTSVSGPAAGLAVIVFDAVVELNSFELFLCAVVIAGFLQLILGFLKAGVIGYFFPSSVIKGMLAGIGLMLIIKQLPIALGFKNSDDFSSFSSAYDFSSIQVLTDFSGFSLGSFIIALVTVSILLVWDLPTIKNNPILKWAPGALIAVLVSVFLNIVWDFKSSSLEVPTEFLVLVPKISTFSEFSLAAPTIDVKGFLRLDIWYLSIPLALIATIETLLSVEAADKVDKQKRITPANRELKAQGIGNIAAGLLGALPVTAVIVRSSANIEAGGKTKLSAILHGLLLLLAILFVSSLLNLIPLSCLAVILVFVGYKLSNVKLYKSFLKLSIEQWLPFISTIVFILLLDLLKGIFIGMILSLFFILKRNFSNSHNTVEYEDDGKKILQIKLSEDVTFLNKGSLLKTFAHADKYQEVVLDVRNCYSVDFDVQEVIFNFQEFATQNGIEVKILK